MRTVASRSRVDRHVAPSGQLPVSHSFDARRFIDAQDGVWADVFDELWAGHKRTHWMWFVFPQLRGLGSSATARRYALDDAETARAYLAHPLLRQRLDVATTLMLDIARRSLREILGEPDDAKFRSSMTLFASVAPDDGLYRQALARFCEGREDPRTLELLGLDPGAVRDPEAGRLRATA